MEQEASLTGETDEEKKMRRSNRSCKMTAGIPDAICRVIPAYERWNSRRAQRCKTFP